MTPDQQQAAHFAKFRNMTPVIARNTAMRAALAAPEYGINFHADMYTLTVSQFSACAAMAKAIGWRKGTNAMQSLGGAFFCYLARDMQRNQGQQQAMSQLEQSWNSKPSRKAARQSFTFGKGW